jgi:hypothetical protein
MYGEILFIWVRACAKGAVKVNFSAFSEVFEIEDTDGGQEELFAILNRR